MTQVFTARNTTQAAWRAGWMNHFCFFSARPTESKFCELISAAPTRL